MCGRGHLRLAAPTACALLADFGAEVIKVENPDSPDITRSWGAGAGLLS